MEIKLSVAQKVVYTRGSLNSLDLFPFHLQNEGKGGGNRKIVSSFSFDKA